MVADQPGVRCVVVLCQNRGCRDLNSQCAQNIAAGTWDCSQRIPPPHTGMVRPLLVIARRRLCLNLIRILVISNRAWMGLNLVVACFQGAEMCPVSCDACAHGRGNGGNGGNGRGRGNGGNGR